MFPDIAKIAGVSSLDKDTDDKYFVTNFRPVGVLNTFSKIYKKIVKDFLISKMELQFHHDFLVAKLDAYGFNIDTVAYIYSYLKNRKQCVKINGTQSYLGDIISGVPQGSILGPILYNLFFSDFFYFILLATAHNSADDNTLACFSKTIQELIGFLESECEVPLN